MNFQSMKRSISIIIAILFSTVAFSQKKEKDTLGTEVINVVRPYSPTVSDAFKVKSTPEINDAEIEKKKQINYSIFSVPVASTFTPAKGKPKVLKVDPSAPVYENYVSAAIGSYKTPIIEAFAHTNTTRYNDIGGFFKYHSSAGGIKDVKLNDDFLDASSDMYYKEENRYFDWQANGGVRFQRYNWYGLPEDYMNFTSTALESIDEEHKYTTVSVGGKINFYDALFQGGAAQLNLFSDNEASSEIHLLAKPKLEIPVASELIEVEGRLEFLTGDFFRDYEGTNDIKYTFFTAGINPSLEILRDHLTIQLGADLIVSHGTADGDGTKTYVYPDINASYVLIDQVLTLYAGATGGMHQNTYRDVTNENPFVSPTLRIKRTDELYNVFGGFKGKLASNINYNFKGSYKSEKDKPLYKLNPTKTEGSVAVERGYEAGNSFMIVYDDVKTISAFGEISVDFSKELKFGGTLEYNIYDMSVEQEAWNLPTIKASAFANFNRDKWFAGANLFFVGERKDELSFYYPQNPGPISIENGNYLDLNLNGGYKFTDKFTVFARVNNVFDSRYQRFANYDVQGLQFLGGLTYKFDF